jgi:lipopolysaccharide/colanic/teichoic acid biosynthesis glycosyltransferase
VVKRSVDIVLAGILLTASIPIIVFAAILIRMDSRGAVVFRQVRMGRRFRTFQILKLRTMNASDHPGPFYTLGADERVTRVGAWLRRLKVDELPQLWQVLCGEMSLVGPRPVVPELTEEFRGEYERLLEVRPGLTDPAALKYCQEAEILAAVPDPLQYFKSVVTPDKLRISEAYMRRASVWSDLGVMAKTFAVLLLTACPGAMRDAFETRAKAIPEAAQIN